MEFIKRLIKAAIESFPISERKKAELLNSILQKRACGGDKDVLQ